MKCVWKAVIDNNICLDFKSPVTQSCGEYGEPWVLARVAKISHK